LTAAPHVAAGGFELELGVACRRGDTWEDLPLARIGDDGFQGRGNGILVGLALERIPAGHDWHLTFEADFPTRVRLRLRLLGERGLFHLIPCNIHGDNNLALTGPGEYPHLTDQFADTFAAP
jgi:hypothetical protein